MSLDAYSLAELLHPITPAQFETEYRERRPLLVQRSQPDYYRRVLTREAIDRVITTMHPKFPDVFITNARRGEVKSTQYCYPSGLIDAGRLFQQFADGGTIVMSNLELHLSELANLCRSLELELSARFQANIYLTPASAQGFRRHWDSHDVFVVQVEGSKRWRVYDTPVVLPLPGENFDPRDLPEPKADAVPTMEFVLEAGDVFYLPRGIMHEAESTEAHSLHITVGTFGVSWSQLLLEAVAKVGVRHEAMRRSLPMGFAHPSFDREEARRQFREMIDVVLGEADFDAALDHFADDLVSTRHSLLEGQLEQVLRLGELSPDTYVRPRSNLLYSLRRDRDKVTVSCYGAHTTLPAFAAEPLEFALTTERYQVKSLPGELDDEGKRVLIERLVTEGLVRME